MKSLKIGISTLVLYVKRLSENNQQNHIQYDHQELYCDNCDKYFAQLSNEKTMKKHLSNLVNFIRTSSLGITKMFVPSNCLSFLSFCFSFQGHRIFLDFFDFLWKPKFFKMLLFSIKCLI